MLYQESKNYNLAIAHIIYTGRYIIVGTRDIVNLHIIMYEHTVLFSQKDAFL